MTQTVKGSFVEAWVNIAVGFGLNYLMNQFVFGPLLHTNIPWQANLVYGGIMTIVSFFRSFIMRRIFNGLKFGNKPTETERRVERQEARNKFVPPTPRQAAAAKALDDRIYGRY